ncbi:DEAD/DEAH box helicase [Methanocaldococcus indicus]|uniref:DEAD/DEAH box helicase n=1 Tax=Methanocaldococcus indicus TaxID=213231 RepID=UPI003C6CDF45
MNFSDFNLSENTLKAINKKGYKTPTEIQKEVIPIFLNENVNIVAQAITGSGKTAAFAIPLVELVSEKNEALILTPTRELAIQVANEIESLTNNLKVVKIYGGKPIYPQIKELKKSNIVVGTPGRVLDHINRGTFNLDNVKYLVLDEADEMLNMGFIDDVEKIIRKCENLERILLFSATMPKEILNLVKKYLGDYKFIKIEISNKIEQSYYLIKNDNEKFNKLVNLLKSDFYGIVFCETKKETKILTKKLKDKGIKVEEIHGDLKQNARERAVRLLKNKKIKVLISTDVMCRGIDIRDLTHIINYNLPNSPEKYIHRIGRTGRAGKKGHAISLIHRRDLKKLRDIERINKIKINKAE